MGAENEGETPEVGAPDLLGVCRLLNEHGVRYLIYGGMACNLHGHERTTRDVDVFVQPTLENMKAALAALSKWGDGFARELTPEDIIENVVVRICDRFILDVSSKVWKLEWDTAWKNRRIVQIEGVDIPILSRADLVRSKQTYREGDVWDVRALRSLSGPEPGRPAEP
ncbi:MAG: hypothetical protein JXB04_09770 [Kiritimatiellae bacterium]|nr:hypothetical protein [Kiritimatiellia bacterium]